jgi:hypothetical protein
MLMQARVLVDGVRVKAPEIEEIQGGAGLHLATDEKPKTGPSVTPGFLW